MIADASSLGREVWPLIITGMHRSGTSLMAGFFHRSGINLGDELMGARPSNPYGHFEDVGILEFHRSVLQRAFGHTLWVPGPPRPTVEERAKAEALVTARSNKGQAWGWKEPRTCLFLDLWSDLLPSAHFVFVIRHPRLVLDSLGRRNKTRFYHFWAHNRFLRGWQVYNAECLRFYQEKPSRCLLVCLESIVQAPKLVVDHLSLWLGVPLSVQVFQELYDPKVLAERPVQMRLASPWLYQSCMSLYRRMSQAGQCPGANRSAGTLVEWGPGADERRRPTGTGRTAAKGQGGQENR